jgi:Coenzyme PQQ synthesis protein D (PqqD)
MTADSNQTPQRIIGDHFIVEQLMNEVMIYDQKRNKAFCLNQKAAFVWQHCDGRTTIDDLTPLLQEVSSEPIDVAVIQFALETLAADGLLEPSTFESRVPAGMTRRSLMQKFGLSAAMSLPVVTALLVATPRAHASSLVPGMIAALPPPRRRHHREGDPRFGWGLELGRLARPSRESDHLK